MPWMLQPHNWTQAIRPNLYNVDYRRVGAYKGMGRFMGRGLGQNNVTCDPNNQYCVNVGTYLANLPTAAYSVVTEPPSPGTAAAAGEAGLTVQSSSQLLPQITSPSGGTMPTWLWVVGGGLLLVLFMRQR